MLGLNTQIFRSKQCVWAGEVLTNEMDFRSHWRAPSVWEKSTKTNKQTSLICSLLLEIPVCACVAACVDHKTTSGVVPQVPSNTLLGTVSCHLNSASWVGWLASEPRNPPVSTSQGLQLPLSITMPYLDCFLKPVVLGVTLRPS